MKSEDLEGKIIGAVRLENRWRLFANFLADWIMDYPSYDPGWNRPTTQGFRDNLWIVNEYNASKFCQVIAEHELLPDDIRLLVENEGAWSTPLMVLIDFDEKKFVNGFVEIAIERYIPPGWIGVRGEPFDYLPEDLQSLWDE